jgi:hypothetical protein
VTPPNTDFRTRPSSASPHPRGSASSASRLLRFAICPWLFALCLSACVTEKPRSRGISVPPNASPADVAAARQASNNQPLELPKGPVASPVTGATTNSRVQAELLPLGSIPYDALVLPISSPSGRFLATHENEAPTWPTLLAADDACVPTSTRLSIFALSDTGLEPVAPVEPLPPGLILGRAADDEGFLVEAPQPDASRWIAKVSWVSARLTWLVRSNHVNAHAVLLPDNTILYTRRAIAGLHSALVLRRPDGAESVVDNPAFAFAFPIATRDPSLVYALGLGESSISILAVRLISESGILRLGSITARRELAPSADLALAYQIASPVQSTATLRSPTAPPSPEPPAIFVPSLNRMAVFDPATSELLPLVPNSIAAVRFHSASASGYFCTTPHSLTFTPEPRRMDTSEQQRRNDAKIIQTPFVPRATTDPNRPILLLGPSKSDPTRLQLVALRPSSAP